MRQSWLPPPDVGHDSETGKRRQIRRRFTTQAAARSELAKVQGGVTAGTYVHSNKLTVDQVCEAWLASKHSLKDSTLAGHRSKLAALRDELGHLEVVHRPPVTRPTARRPDRSRCES